MNLRFSSDDIKAEAKRLGFFACGIARADRVDEAYANKFRQCMERHDFADMHYMYEHVEKRLDPRLLMPGVKSIVCVALNYTPAVPLSAESYQIAAYALGQDYHDVVKRKLWQLTANLGISEGFRCFVDTAPVLERYWAQQAGIGWIGRSQQLIIPGGGSMFFLGELFLDIGLTYDTPMPNRCGNCRRCIAACPTQALTLEGEQGSRLDANRCLSYQTIENRGALTEEAKAAMGNCIYGCDRCQQACPWNQKAVANSHPELQPSPLLLQMRREDWTQLTEETYRKLFKGSAVKRAKYSGLMRNIRAVEENTPQKS